MSLAKQGPTPFSVTAAGFASNRLLVEPILSTRIGIVNE